MATEGGALDKFQFLKKKAYLKNKLQKPIVGYTNMNFYIKDFYFQCSSPDYYTRLA